MERNIYTGYSSFIILLKYGHYCVDKYLEIVIISIRMTYRGSTISRFSSNSEAFVSELALNPEEIHPFKNI